MDFDWKSLDPTAKIASLGGGLMLLGAVLPWLSYPGGSASLLMDGTMEIVATGAFGSPNATEVGNSSVLVAVLVAGAVVLGVPQWRRWDWKSALAVTAAGAAAYFPGAFLLVILRGDLDGAIVGGEPVATTVSAGVGAYSFVVGAAAAGLAGLVALIVFGIRWLRS